MPSLISQQQLRSKIVTSFSVSAMLDFLNFLLLVFLVLWLAGLYCAELVRRGSNTANETKNRSPSPGRNRRHRRSRSRNKNKNKKKEKGNKRKKHQHGDLKEIVDCAMQWDEFSGSDASSGDGEEPPRRQFRLSELLVWRAG